MSVEETDFQFLTENSRDLILHIGMDLKYYYVSPASLSLLGWHPEEMIGKHVSSFVCPEDFPLVAAVVERALTKKCSKALTRDGWTSESRVRST